MPNRLSRVHSGKSKPKVEIMIEDFDFMESPKENDTSMTHINMSVRSSSNEYSRENSVRNLSESPARLKTNLLKPIQDMNQTQHFSRRFSFGSTFLFPESLPLNSRLTTKRQSSMPNNKKISEENKIEENPLGNSFEKISVLRNSNNNLKLGSLLSTTGQCAMLKTYEDEMFKQLKRRFPNKILCRVGTSKYNSIINNQSRNVNTYDENSVELLARQLKITEHITEAMEILDELSYSNQKVRNEGVNEIHSKGENETITRYEKWQLKWANMLNFMF